MVRVKRNVKLLITVGLLWVCGCTSWSSFRTRVHDRIFAKASDESSPPQRSPLYISGEPKPIQQATVNLDVSAIPPIAPALASLPPMVSPGQSNSQAALNSPIAQMRLIQREASQRLSSVNSYIMRLKRREVVNGTKRPEELILFKFRRQPFSVYCKWIGPESHNREVIFVKGQHGSQIHTKVAAGDVPLMPAGKRIALAPDSLLVRSNARHPITDAGLEHMVDQFGHILDGVEKGDMRFGTLKFLGVLKRPEFDNPVQGVLQVIPPRSESLLARGGQRFWFFDDNSHLPVLMITRDEKGQEVEYYCHDRIQFPVSLDDDDFSPDKLWGKQ
jgi:uncharacterized protein DUF1571